MSQHCNILISSAGRRVVLVRLFQQALRELGIRGKVDATDLTALASGFHAAEEGFLAPLFTSDDFIPKMIELCQRQDIRLLIPTVDPELSLYADHLEDFANVGTTIAISKPETIKIGGDKIRTHQWLAENNFPTPRQTTIEDVLANPNDWPMPLIVKPAIGSSSVGIARIKQIDDLRNVQRYGQMIVETIAQGDEYTVDVYIDRQGKPRCSVPRLRLETRGGEVSKGIAVRNRKIQDVAEQICDKLPGAYGVFNVQMFVHRETGEIQVTEFNPRFGGGFPLAHQAGAHMPHWLVEESLGLPLSAVADQWQDGLVMLRYDDAIYVTREQAGL